MKQEIMTKERLKNYIFLNGELKDLEMQRERLEKQLSNTVSDIVKGSSSEFPYTQRTMKISGQDTKKQKKIYNLIDRIDEQIDKINTERQYIMHWIDTITESRMRRLMRYKYIENYSWVKISFKLNYSSADAARMAHDRFIKKFL